MKTQSLLNVAACSSLALALSLALWSPVRASEAEEKKPAEPSMMDKCKAMMEHHAKMKEDAKSQDAELAELLTKLNGASDDKKIGLLAAIVNRLVEQRIATHARMGKMEEEMENMMKQHMQMTKECPMMGMSGAAPAATAAPGAPAADDKAADPHKGHH